MNYRKKILSLFILTALGLCSQLGAFTYSFTNLSNKKLTLDYCGEVFGIPVLGCSMLQGIIPKWHGGGFTEMFEPNTKTTTYKNAGYLKAPIIIQAGATVTMNHNGIDVSACIDLANIKVGVAGGTMMPRVVKNMPNDARDNVYAAVTQLGGAVEAAGQTILETVAGGPDIEVGEIKITVPGAPGLEKAEIVGMAAVTLGKLIDSLGQVAKTSPCKNLSFWVVEDERGVLHVLTFGL